MCVSKWSFRTLCVFLLQLILAFLQKTPKLSRDETLSLGLHTGECYSTHLCSIISRISFVCVWCLWSPVCSGWLLRLWCVRRWRTRRMTIKQTFGLWASHWSSWLRLSRPTTSSTPWEFCWKLPSLSPPPWSSPPSGKTQRPALLFSKRSHHFIIWLNSSWLNVKGFCMF